MKNKNYFYAKNKILIIFVLLITLSVMFVKFIFLGLPLTEKLYIHWNWFLFVIFLKYLVSDQKWKYVIIFNFQFFARNENVYIVNSSLMIFMSFWQKIWTNSSPMSCIHFEIVLIESIVLRFNDSPLHSCTNFLLSNEK